VTDPNLKNNLYQAISQAASLDKFSAMMAKTGYDKVVGSSKTYTVWAPTDQALQSLDPAILNDTAKLRLFVGNHISNQTYLAGAGIGSQRIQMLNGKYNNTTGTTFDSANIITANQYANNGVYHIIDKYIPRYDNCWEFLQNTSAAPMMKTMLLSLNYIFFDSTKATQIGVDPNTGHPIWDSTNGKILRNHFLDNAMNVSDETGQYTFVLIADGGYNTELSRITPYFKTGATDSTNNLAGYHLVKDFAFKGVYTPAQLPVTLVSTYGVHVSLSTANVLASYKTSNGIVYIMSDVTFQFTDKFPPIVIQGENPVAFAADRTSDIFYRIRKDSLGNIFNDIYALNYNYASYWIQYIAHGLYSTKYNISWVALNDVQTTPLWQQKLSIDSANNTTYLPYVTVQYDVFAEIPLGQWTLPAYRDVPLYVVGPATASSAGGVNSISLDYIKLTPLP
jgi:uncharacterized surface protein with fasciclin (FAS1) repeats